MDLYVYWIVAAIVLVIVEILTGTFYLLVLGIAASAAAAVAYFDFAFPVQAAVASAVGVVGVLLVHRYHVHLAKTAPQSNAIDVGHRVTLDSWINEAEGLARVRYRGTLWDAKVTGMRRDAAAFYIRGVDGSTLEVEADA